MRGLPVELRTSRYSSRTLARPANANGSRAASVVGPRALMLAAASQGVIQAAHTRWYVNGGDLATAIGEGLAVLETGIAAGPRT